MIDEELAAEYALGLLSVGARAQIDDQRRADPALDRELAALEEDLALAMTAELSPIVPTRALPLAGPERFAPFLPAIMRVFDLSREAALVALAMIDDASAWVKSPIRGLRELHFTAGSVLAGRTAGFVSMQAGMRFPTHRHLGTETGVVLEGQLHDSGKVHVPGDVVEWSAETVHHYEAAPGRDLLLMVAHGGIEIVRRTKE